MFSQIRSAPNLIRKQEKINNTSNGNFKIKTSERILRRFEIIFKFKKVNRTLHISSKITRENMKSDKNMEICTKSVTKGKW